MTDRGDALGTGKNLAAIHWIIASPDEPIIKLIIGKR